MSRITGIAVDDREGSVTVVDDVERFAPGAIPDVTERLRDRGREPVIAGGFILFAGHKQLDRDKSEFIRRCVVGERFEAFEDA
ncbi:MAG: hypothetical protein IPK58_03980 [Acidobacteria bacterium]|nr:hypothetical protein [Acidobacteriota bacterium]